MKQLPWIVLALAVGACEVDAPVETLGTTASPLTADEALGANRQRLLDGLARRLDPDQDACELWGDLSPSQRGAFLTITHRLQIATILDLLGAPSPLLDHTTALYAIHGNEERRPWELPCGGINANRLFFSMDTGAWSALALARLAPANQPVVADFGATGGDGPVRARRWRDTRDDPHAPFDASTESQRGGPRVQTHFFSDLVARPLVDRGAGTAGIVDPYLLEVDQDYDFFHSSDTECRNFRGKYLRNYGREPGFAQVDYGWQPSCDDDGGGNPHPECDVCSELGCDAAPHCWDADEHGFACCSI